MVRTSHAGERLVPTVLAGRTMRVVGSLDQPHSFTYVPDLAAAMIRRPRARTLWNSFLHAPTRRAGDPAPADHEGRGDGRRTRAEDVGDPGAVLGAVGLVSRDMRELAETGYMFARPFVVDSTASEERLGLSPTSLTDGLAATVAWWRAQEQAAGLSGDGDRGTDR